MLRIFYKVFNEVDFLKESLASVYDYADEIIMMEYCLDSMRKIISPNRVTKDGLSTDGTSRIIKKFPDPEKKIKYWPIGFIYGGEHIPYQMIVDSAEVGDYVWVMDGDIVYPDKLCKSIRQYVDTGRYDCLWIPERVFYHDFYHEKIDWFKYHQRVFRIPKGLSFYFPRCWEIHWFDHVPGVDEKSLFFYLREAGNELAQKYKDYKMHGRAFRTYAIDPDREGFAYHYALVRDIQKILEKMIWQYNMIDRRWNNEVERKACKTFGKDPLEFKLTTHDYFINHEPQNRAKFEGEHPPLMAYNKWADYHWDEKPVEISYYEARKLIGNPGEC